MGMSAAQVLARVCFGLVIPATRYENRAEVHPPTSHTATTLETTDKRALTVSCCHGTDAGSGEADGWECVRSAGLLTANGGMGWDGMGWDGMGDVGVRMTAPVSVSTEKCVSPSIDTKPIHVGGSCGRPHEESATKIVALEASPASPDRPRSS